MSSIDERVYGYEPATSQLKQLRAEIERLKAENKRVSEYRGMLVYAANVLRESAEAADTLTKVLDDNGGA